MTKKPTTTELTPYNFKTIVTATEPNDYDAELAKVMETWQVRFSEAANAAMLTAMMLTSPRPTCLRVRPDGSLEVVELYDDGTIVEPLRCTCGRWGAVTRCAIHSGVT